MIEVNGNLIYRDGSHWIIESADGSWTGYEIYDTEEEAIEAAQQETLL